MAQKVSNKIDLVEKDNYIGIEAQKIKQREQAINALLEGKKVERYRKEVGFIWISKGNISKQIHPDKWVFHLTDQWKKIIQ